VRRPGWLPFAAAGGTLIVAGGLVSAVNGATAFAHGSWLAAYLVLVGGVAQVALGLGPPALGAPEPAPWLTRAQLILWNAGSLVVPAGVLSGLPGLVAAGSVALLAALSGFAIGARRTAGRRGGALAYRALLAVLGVSVFVGLALAVA
jgi:hypothetical protein